MPRHRRQFLTDVVAGVAVLGVGCVSSSESSLDTTPTEEPAQPTSNPATETTAGATPVDTTTNTAAETRTAAPTDTSAETTATVPRPNATRTNGPDETTRNGSATEVPMQTSFACDGSLRRLDYPIDEVRYDSLGGFELTASETTVELADSITFRLENSTNTRRTSGNKEIYDIQRQTDEGWHSIYWVGDAVAYTDEGILHSPGTGLTWEFTLTSAELEHATWSNTPYSVCEDLSPGEYRFIYWGIIAKQTETSDSETEHAVGVRFTIEE